MNPALAQLERAAAEMRLALPPRALDCFEVYLDEVLSWRHRINLTAASTAQDLVSLHFVDSLLPLSFLEFPPNARVADIGSGAGFPGVPLKIVRPDLRLTLIEASRRRVAFLEHLRASLGYPDIEVVWGRAEVLGRQAEFREAFGVVLSRAAARAGVAAELCLPLAAISGVVVLLKGADAHSEIAAANPLIERLGGRLEASETRHLPTTDRWRLLAVIRKVRPCGPEFPRNVRHLGQTTA